MNLAIQKSEQNIEPNQNPEQIVEADIKKKVVVLSTFYFLVTVSLASFLNVIIYIHQKYRHKGYGQSYLTANSITSVITYFFCPMIIQRVKNSKSLLIACVVGYLINLLIPAILSATEPGMQSQSHQNMPPPSTISFLLEILANMFGGAASSLFWVIQGIYMTKYCLAVPQNKKGKYFSLANVILNSRIAIGPLITMIGLGMGNQTTYFTLLSVIILSSIPLAYFYIPAISLTDQQPKPLAKNEDNELQQVSQPTSPFRILRYLLSFFAYFKQVRFLIPGSILAGLVVGFVASSLSHLLPHPPVGQNNDTKIGIALFFFGLGNILGGHLSGVICDSLSIKTGGYIGSLLVIVGSIVEAVCLSIKHTVGRSSLVGFFSGISYSYVLSFVVIVCTIQFQGKTLSFTTNKLVTSFSYICYQWTVAFLNNKCNMKLNMTYQGLALIPLALLAAYCNKAQCDSYERTKFEENSSSVQLDIKKANKIKEGKKQKQELHEQDQ